MELDEAISNLEEAMYKLSKAMYKLSKIVEGANYTLTPNDVQGFAEDAYSEIKGAIEWIKEVKG